MKYHHVYTRSDRAYTGLGNNPRHKLVPDSLSRTASPRGSRHWVVTGTTVGTRGATVGMLHPAFLVELVDEGHG